MSDIREASLEPEQAGLPGGAIMQVGPFALLAVAALWLWAHWRELPERLPAHWSWRGDPDRFISRTALGATMPLLIGTFVCVLLLAIQAGIRYGAVRSPLRRLSLRVLLAGEYLASVACCGSLLAMTTAGRILTPLLVICCAIAAALLAATLAIALNRPRLRARNPAAWHGGVFYVDREDPALFVPKRIGIGYTFNFGNPRAIALACAVVALSLAVVFLALSAR
ncbi:MAG TPA: DUF5808 domain-containing protein [Myxococcales bacterium]|nr:DUF5808 domain-containing protein [Myxococcales bacterium]